MAKITPIDIQHKEFKKAIQGYDRTEVNIFLDEIIETLEDEASARAALEAEIIDLRERISHFKSMEESLQNTLVLAQRTADEVKASAHKEADLIRQEARVATEREIMQYQDRANEARRDYQAVLGMVEKARSELRAVLMTHLNLLDRDVAEARAAAPAIEAQPAAIAPRPPADPLIPSEPLDLSLDAAHEPIEKTVVELKSNGEIPLALNDTKS
jgi:cell division initiation protein